MKQILLDGAELFTMEQVHAKLASELAFPEWYGKNLDALYDCLTETGEQTDIVLANFAMLEEHLGRKADALRRVLQDACDDNPCLSLEKWPGKKQNEPENREGDSVQPNQPIQEGNKMSTIKFYGADICKDCRAAHPLLEEKGIETEYIDITASTANLRAFLSLRDHDAAFDEVKKEGRIGIPAFVFPDGSVTLGIEWLEGTGCCQNC